jgi:hypothetical protein
VSAFILAKKGFIPATNHDNRIERALGLHFDYSPEYSSFYLDERDIPQPADEFGHPESRQRPCTLAAVGGAPTLSITAGGARSGRTNPMLCSTSCEENSDCDFDLEILEPGCSPRDAFGGELEARVPAQVKRIGYLLGLLTADNCEHQSRIRGRFDRCHPQRHF